MQFATVNDVTLHYQEIGGPTGTPTLVFINSLGSDFRIWRDVIVRFVGEVSIMTYDKRGHGLSNIGDTPYTIEDHAEDLIALLDHLGKKDVVLVGLSVGGLIAQAVYKMRPDLVEALVLCDTAAKIGTAEMWQERIDSIEEKGMVELAEATMLRWFTSVYRQKNRDDVAGYRNMLARQPQDGYLGTCMAIRDADYTADAKVITAPTMCIVGLNDVVTTPEHVYELSMHIDGSRYEEISGAGHLPCIEKPQDFSILLKDFLKELKEETSDSAPDGVSVH
ncbi:3-oxoadipate enol-lactonase [Ahrensia sp. 13_GOM-1096m]|uniref:3-oxoadipate enol-lactonase n=1 Tax=Ahrensia sp. 13_GOM-1096m TaxID=1380380 RepID=UPI000687B674|nr:3-oxoadipate enol-lactonase [Ahrensia sp. 13_GOM-1096m]